MKQRPTSANVNTSLIRRFLRILAANLLSILVGGNMEVFAESKGNIRITPGHGMTLRLEMPSGDDWFLLMLPKTIGERKMSMVNFPDAKIAWEVFDGEQHDTPGMVRCRTFSGVLIEYSIELVPHSDYIEATLAIKNHTDYTWHEVWMFTLLAPHGAPDFTETGTDTPAGDIKRNAPGSGRFVEVAGQPRELSEIDRTPMNLSPDSDNKRRELLAMLPEEKPPQEVVRFMRELDAMVMERSSGAWMAGVDTERQCWIGMVVPEPVFFFTNDEIRSLHVAPNFGTIGPGEESMMKVRFYIAQGTLKNAISRMKADRKELIESSKPARPKSLKTFE